jgi:hypothetical protein
LLKGSVSICTVGEGYHLVVKGLRQYILTAASDLNRALPDAVWEQMQCGSRCSVGADAVWEQMQCGSRCSVGAGLAF